MLKAVDKLADIRFKFNEQGLMPAVVQDYQTKEVLMLAYVDGETLKLSLEKGETVFYSRSRQEIWHKGATSGNTQKIKEIYYDCDQDTILFLVDPAGPACHTGEKSCFYRQLTADSDSEDKAVQEDVEPPKESEQKPEYREEKIVDFLYQLILNRKEELPEDSYTSYLFEEGIDKILKKVGEESAEVIIAAKNKEKSELIYESADLIYHLLVLLAQKDVRPEEIRKELFQRHR